MDALVFTETGDRNDAVAPVDASRDLGIGDGAAHGRRRREQAGDRTQLVRRSRKPAQVEVLGVDAHVEWQLANIQRTRHAGDAEVDVRRGGRVQRAAVLRRHAGVQLGLAIAVRRLDARVAHQRLVQPHVVDLHVDDAGWRAQGSVDADVGVQAPVEGARRGAIGRGGQPQALQRQRTDDGADAQRCGRQRRGITRRGHR